MKNPVALSVILPTIGRPKYFMQTLAALTDQSTSEFELLVSDNASSPCLSNDEIAQVSAIANARLVTRKTRLTFAEHFNACLADATGEWCVFVSDDDLVSNRFVEKIIDAINSNPGASVIFPRQNVIDEDFFEIPENNSNPFECWDSLEFLQKAMQGQIPNFFTAVSMVHNRDQVMEFGGFPNYPSGAHADNYVWCRLSLIGHTVVLPPVMNYRVYAASFGLSMPFLSLLKATIQFEKDIQKLFQPRDLTQAFDCWVASNSACLNARWKKHLADNRFSFRDWRSLLLLMSRFARTGEKDKLADLLSFPAFLRRSKKIAR